MKSILGSLLLLLLAGTLQAQFLQGPAHFKAAYWGHFGFQPGLKIGADWSVTDFGKSEGTAHQLYLGPEVSVFTNPGFSTNLLLGADLSYRRQGAEKGFFQGFALGLGYLREFEVLSQTVNLSDGSIAEKERQGRGYLLPAVHYYMGKEISEQCEGYLKLGYGKRYGSELVNTGMLFVELGIRFSLNKNN